MKNLETLKAKLPARHLKLFNVEVKFRTQLLKCTTEESEAACIDKWLNINKLDNGFRY